MFSTSSQDDLSRIGASPATHLSGVVLLKTVGCHPHMLRHACGFKLANDGHDTWAIQHYLGHRNVQHTVGYTELASDRFKKFWLD
jgi:site-specific recombinase XerD